MHGKWGGRTNENKDTSTEVVRCIIIRTGTQCGDCECESGEGLGIFHPSTVTGTALRSREDPGHCIWSANQLSVVRINGGRSNKDNLVVFAVLLKSSINFFKDRTRLIDIDVKDEVGSLKATLGDLQLVPILPIIWWRKVESIVVFRRAEL